MDRWRASPLPYSIQAAGVRDMVWPGNMLKEDLRAMRAARSYAYNLDLRERVEGRLERARTTLEGYLLLRGSTSAQLGAFRVDLDDDGLSITRSLADEGWEQMNMEDTLAEIEMRQELDAGY